MDVQTTTVPGVIMFQCANIIAPEKQTTEISVPQPLIYSHLAVLHNVVTKSWTFRDRIPVGTRFSPRADRPGAHPASFKMGSVSLPLVKCGRGVLLTTHLRLVQRSWKSRAIPQPPSGPHWSCNGVNLPCLNVHNIL